MIVPSNQRRVVEYLRIPTVTPKARPPPAPVSPKALPPTRPPPLYLTNSITGPNLTAVTLNTLGPNFHPPLRYIESLTSTAFVTSQQTRTGLVNPPLPLLDHPSNHTETMTASSLRTTPEGIRLEITPEAMIRRRLDPELYVPPATPPSPAPERRASLPPELDPEQ